MKKHSKGPWWVEGPPGNKNACFHEGNNYAICHVSGKDGDEEQTPTIAEVWPTVDPEIERADAYLIAAAPDLLAACRYVVELSRTTVNLPIDMLLKCSAAVEKAESC